MGVQLALGANASQESYESCEAQESQARETRGTREKRTCEELDGKKTGPLVGGNSERNT